MTFAEEKQQKKRTFLGKWVKMLRQKVRDLKIHPAVCLEDLVPPNNFYRHVEAKLDLSFVRDLVKDCYSVMGRPSIDPVVFFKLQLIMFFEGIRSERQLMETVNVNLAHRWYIGYDLDEAVPDHSSLTKIRERYGLEAFERFFEKIVELCIDAGLVWGKELYFDGTKVRANADIDKEVPRFYWEAQQQMKALFGQAEPTSIPQKPTGSSRGLTEKYNGQRLIVTANTYQRLADYRVCPTDPDATPVTNGHESGRLGYTVHYVVDSGKARIILAALATLSSIQDNTPMLDLARWVRFRWKLHPKIAVGDSKFGSHPNIVGLEQDGILPYLGRADHGARTTGYPVEMFRYDAEQNCYICPQGHRLKFSGNAYTTQYSFYRASVKDCQACPVKAEWTPKAKLRVIRRSFYQEYMDRLDTYAATPAYLKAMRKRSVWIEPLFGEAKQWHQLVMFRLRRLWRVNIQTLLTAAGQNIKRLLRPPRTPLPPRPAVVIALAVPPPVAPAFPLFIP